MMDADGKGVVRRSARGGPGREAAQRTLDGEDRSAIIQGEGKGGSRRRNRAIRRHGTITYFIVLYYDLPARISALRALTSALSSAMSCDSRLGSSIAFSLCGGGLRRRGTCRRNLRKSQKPTQGERPPITNAWIASPPVRNQRRPRPKPAPGKTATAPRRIKNALRVADSVSVPSEQQQRAGGTCISFTDVMTYGDSWR